MANDGDRVDGRRGRRGEFGLRGFVTFFPEDLGFLLSGRGTVGTSGPRGET